MRLSFHQSGFLSLRALWPEATFLGAPDIQVRACSSDSRQCSEGDLFVALPGSRRHGSEFAADALARGAAGLLAEQAETSWEAPVCLVRDVRRAYGQLCHALRGNPTRQLRTVGVTGTNGKTTTTYLISAILDEAGYCPGVLGTLGYCDGDEMAAANWTTPPADALAHWLSRMLDNHCSHAVMEVSSHALDQDRVAGVEFDVACVTNVSRDHLDYHGSLADYWACKKKLFDHVSPTGLVVINADDPGAKAYLKELDGPVLTVGVNQPAEIMGETLEQSLSEQTFLVTAGDETIPVRTPLIGKHNLYNCLVATAVGLTYGLELTTIVRGIESVRRIPGRLERVEQGQPFRLFVDYAHTPDALAHSLQTLNPLTPGRLICVFGAGGDRDRDKRPLMGRAVEEVADVVVITSDNPRSEDPQQIIGQIRDGMKQPTRAHVEADRSAAIEWALGEAREGDCVLIAGKGHETYQEVDGIRLDFDDREVAREWLDRELPSDWSFRAAA